MSWRELDEEKKADLKYFFPSVIRRVRTRRRAKPDWRARALLGAGDRPFSPAARDRNLACRPYFAGQRKAT